MRDTIYKDTHMESRQCRFYIGEMGVSAVTMTQALQLLRQQVLKGTPSYVCFANLEATALAQRDAGFRMIHNCSLLTLPDGMPLIWYARIVGESRVERITGPDILIKVLKMSSQYGFTHYFYGDTKETLVTLTQVIRNRFPDAIIKGMHSPPFRELRDNELHAVVEEINRLRPSFVWIGLGCPKQEKWMAQALPNIESGVLVGVGAAFRFLIGHYRHPAKIVQLAGLEGIFWRAPHGLIDVAKWYSRYIPVCASLLLKALVKRILRLRTQKPHAR